MAEKNRMTERWFKLFLIAVGMILSIASAAGGFIYSELRQDIDLNRVKFEDHQLAQFSNDLATAERLKAIEVVLQNILEELRDP
jgi:hypothetical protein